MIGLPSNLGCENQVAADVDAGELVTKKGGRRGWKRAKSARATKRKTLSNAAGQAELEIHEASICLKSPEELEKETVQELATGAVSVGGLLSFLCKIHSGIVMEFEPDETTTAQVVFQAIIPLTARSGSSFAKMVNAGEDRYPDVMISHAWGNPFLHLVAAALGYALKQPVYYNLIPMLRTVERTRALMSELAEDVLKVNVWLCICGVNQHRCICSCHKVKYLNDDPRCQMDKFDHMLHFLHQHCGKTFEQVIVPGLNGVALTRAWVVSEIATCMSLGIKQGVALRLPVKISNGDSPLKGRLESLDVRNCNSSRPEDKEKILAAIDDKDAYNQRVRMLLENCIQATTSSAIITVHLVCVIVVALLGIALFVFVYSENQLSERIGVLGPGFVEGPVILLTYRWWLENEFLLKSLKRADRQGLCHEVMQAVPAGTSYLLPWDRLCRRVALACDGIPSRWRRTGEMLLLIPTTLFLFVLSLAVLSLAGSTRDKLWAVVVGIRAILWALSSTILFMQMTFNDDIRVCVLPTVLLINSVFLTGAVHWCSRWMHLKKFTLTMNPLELSCICACCVICLIFMWSHRIYDMYIYFLTTRLSRGLIQDSACFSSQESVLQKIDNFVHAWSETTVCVSNLAANLESREMEQVFAEMGPLVGVFLSLDLEMCSKSSATVTYCKRDHAMKAVEQLDGLELRKLRIQVQPVKHETSLGVFAQGGEAEIREQL